MTDEVVRSCCWLFVASFQRFIFIEVLDTLENMVWLHREGP